LTPLSSARRLVRRVWNRLPNYTHRTTAPLRVLPDFMVIGTQKGGSTSMYKYLVQHPEVYRVFGGEEVHYFSWFYERGPMWYRSFFPTVFTKALAGGKFHTGEASPVYLFHPEVPARVHRMLPNIKLIALLRNPISRAYSRYQQRLGGDRAKGHKQNEHISFEEAIKIELNRSEEEMQRVVASLNEHSRTYLARGMYAQQIKRWLQYFPMEQMCFIKSEDFFADTAATTAIVLKFIGVSDPSIEGIDFTPYGVGGYQSKMSDEMRHLLGEYFRPHNEELYELLGRDLGW
jgi:hypothetical protein